eukprot:366486-Chlamydomonas_euryale.AAC.8
MARGFLPGLQHATIRCHTPAWCAFSGASHTHLLVRGLEDLTERADAQHRALLVPLHAHTLRRPRLHSCTCDSAGIFAPLTTASPAEPEEHTITAIA